MIQRIAFLVLALVVAGRNSPAGAQADPSASAFQDRLVRMEDGFSLELSGGFEMGKQQDGYYLLGSRTTAGLILVRALPGLTAAGLDRNLRSGYTDDTVQLTPEGARVELATQGGAGRLVAVRGALMDGQVRGLLAGYVRPAGGGVLLFAVTAPDQWPELRPIAERVARSVVLFDPDPQELIRLWHERLSESQLVYAPRGSDRKAAREIFHLCKDGRFIREQPAGDTGSSDQSGKWEIVAVEADARISFTFPDAAPRSHLLRREDIQTYLDDRRYFVLPTERCH